MVDSSASHCNKGRSGRRTLDRKRKFKNGWSDHDEDRNRDEQVDCSLFDQRLLSHGNYGQNRVSSATDTPAEAIFPIKTTNARTQRGQSLGLAGGGKKAWPRWVRPSSRKNSISRNSFGRAEHDDSILRMSEDGLRRYEHAIVGFFDILGYGSFLENNDAADAIEPVLKLFDLMPQEIRDYYASLIQNWAGKSLVQGVLDATKSLVFADTIVLILPYTSPDDTRKALKWSLFVAQTALLARKMFDCGLPIRGAVSFGTCYVKNNCFAGRAISEAHKLERSLEAAAIAFDTSAETEVETIVGKDKMNDRREGFGTGLVKYLHPTKADCRCHYVINFAAPGSFYVGESLEGDERKLVLDRFLKRGKTVSKKEEIKVNNTAALLRFFKSVEPKQ